MERPFGRVGVREMRVKKTKQKLSLVSHAGKQQNWDLRFDPLHFSPYGAARSVRKVVSRRTPSTRRVVSKRRAWSPVVPDVMIHLVDHLHPSDDEAMPLSANLE